MINMMFIYVLNILIFILAKNGQLMMDFFLGENPHNGFNQGKEVARRQAQKIKTKISDE
jgi:hypothetical protein